MSDSSPDIARLIAAETQIKFLNTVVLSGTGKSSVILVIMLYMLIKRKVLYLYDYVLTFPTEISGIWNSKSSAAQALFFCNRSIISCRVISFTYAAFVVPWNIAVYGIFTLRTYALYQGNPIILLIGVFACVANVVIFIYMTVILNPNVISSPLGYVCMTDPSPFRLTLANAIIQLCLDILVFALTFAKTIHLAVEMKKLGLSNGLGYFILRDGNGALTNKGLQARCIFCSLDFCGVFKILMVVLCRAKLLIGVMLIAALFGTLGELGLMVEGLSSPLTAILVNRLVLSLRQVSRFHDGNAPTLCAIRTVPEPVFATNSFLGNVGAPLRVGPVDDDESDDSNNENAFVLSKLDDMGNYLGILYAGHNSIQTRIFCLTVPLTTMIFY
ncbi:hypothetical protein BD410DRAFT_806397 [Rickenella mellea]|uniref:DUF6533 domain-containing protein n=1 Tax=Rickenella mellea TaxID=50990 RepID=A0A4Y7PUI7_9AGAM|nr:hypothetical protein BD410DRAFT_806397 [Rickenella mellea]